MRASLIAIFAILLTSCGPSEAELRAELQSVESEMMAIQIQANQHLARMSQAEAEAFLGSFAVGYGATSGNYGLAGEGYRTASGASRDYDVSAYSLEQLRERFKKLGKRRMEIMNDLR